MSKEFKIYFFYNSRKYRARVVRSASVDGIIYAIRPFSITLAKGYGPQTLIIKRNDHFSCDGQVSRIAPEYINALVAALKEQDIPKLDTTFASPNDVFLI